LLAWWLDSRCCVCFSAEVMLGGVLTNGGESRWNT